MVRSTLKETIPFLVEELAIKHATDISVNVNPEIFNGKSVLCELCEADPRLIVYIKSLQLQVKNYGMWAILSLHIEYTENLCAAVVKVNCISEFRETVFYSANLHRRNLIIVHPVHMNEEIQSEIKQLPYYHQMLNCFVSGVTAEAKQLENCKYMAHVIHLKYSCSYRECISRKNKIADKIDEILHCAKISGIEDWKRAYAVVRYCVENWRYGCVDGKLEYTAYSAIVKNTAVCMGISLAVCYIFKELGIPCKYVHGKRNGEGHAWNMVFIRGGWFYIDVTDAICRKDPLYHWGMVQLHDRIVCEPISESLACHCSPEFIRRMACR